MKIIFITMLFSFSAFAQNIQKSCYSKSAKAVEMATLNDRYDVNGFETQSCEVAPNKTAIICEVFAFKGNGEAFDTYQVVLNKSCSKVFRVDLIGIE